MVGIKGGVEGVSSGRGYLGGEELHVGTKEF